MASKTKQKGMVLQEEGATVPTAAPAAAPPPACFVVLKPGKANEGGLEQGNFLTNKDTDIMAKSNMYSTKEVVKVSPILPAMKHPAKSNLQPDNLSPDSTSKGIKVTLDNNSMWNEFFRCKTEMILTKQGCRMFPYCRFRLSGLEPSKKYSLIMDIQPVDNSRYKWTGQNWQDAGKAERHVKSQPFAHPESPTMGQYWMQNPVSFYKLKLTNNISDQEGNIFLHVMHRYLPRLHVIPSDKAAKDLMLNGPHVITFTFPQTEFMAVTAYQNSRFAQLKVDYNPFAKGLKEDGSSSWALKLKSTTSKDSHKEGGTTTNEQHPVKKSLKSLLANHKPRSSKVVDQKPSTPDAQKTATTDKDPSSAKATGESSCNNARPAQKLFSELIREAHVSLKRCNLDQLCINNSTSCRIEQTDIKNTDVKSKGEDVAEKDKTQNSSVDADCKNKTEAQREENVKPHKRPAPVPLPALALFLKQHRLKPRHAKTRPNSRPVFPPESLLATSHSTAVPAVAKPTDLSKGVSGEITKLGSQASSHTGSNLHPADKVLNVIGQATETGCQVSSPSCQAAVPLAHLAGPRIDCLVSVPVTESPAPKPLVPDGAPVLPESDQLFYAPETTISTIFSSVTTSSPSPIMSSPFDTVLPVPNTSQTPTFTESTILPSSPSTMKSASLHHDSECSPFRFEPLSPASSPDPLPSLPTSLALELNTAPSVPTSEVVPPGQLSRCEDSAISVLKWHTVLPPPDPFLTTFTSFQPTPQPPPLSSSTPPLLPTQIPSHPGPQVLGTGTSCPPSDPATSFQENDQSLPFPAELSPLTLQLPLSPTFSSLDGDALSPTPSIAELVHFFSTDDDLGMEVDFSNTEAAPVPCPPPCTVTVSSQQEQPPPANKPQKCKKKLMRARPAQTDEALKTGDGTDTSMHPNLEEVEEQLFVSFTSKEALKLHLGDTSEGSGMIAQPQSSSVAQPQQSTEETMNAETPESLEEEIAALDKVLLRDMKFMKHRQVIHPVLQEVGLKMNLLDPTLSIDLQYLGVRLPIPPPGVCLKPLSEALAPSQSVSPAFVSRTGKTTDVTQIKGWREKFAPSESLSTPVLSKPEAGPSSDVPKKNLSAFCSDMLDEYLENEGKLIDERAASFSQAVMEPVAYELPTRSTSYVRTLDNVLKKQPLTSPTSALISGFVPPSKRPKMSPMGQKKSRKGDGKQKAAGSKQNKPKPGTAATVSSPSLSPVPTLPAAIPAPKQHMVQSPFLVKANTTHVITFPSEHTAPVTDTTDPVIRSNKKNFQARASEAPHTPLGHRAPITHVSQDPTLKKRKKLKAKASSQTLSPSTAPLGALEDLAPLESDSELGNPAEQSSETSTPDAKPLMTKALLKQKDLEDGVVWEGRPRTCITEERAAIALTSLFTLMGFVCENPTAPIRLVKRRAPPCLNEFCRLGCVCSSLAQSTRITHCGKAHCMFGCSCLRQKVVLLKNLDGPDSSPSDQGTSKKRKRKKRMKMAYILKEGDSVSQPAQRVQTLWRKETGDRDPEPIHTPEPVYLPWTADVGVDKSCARVRGYRGRNAQQHNPNPNTTSEKEGRGRSKVGKRKDAPPKKAKMKSSNPPADSHQPEEPPAIRDPTPSKRLAIMAECRWRSDADRNHVLRKVCEAMAQDRLNQPFWVKTFLVIPLSQTMEEDDDGRCIHYKVHISEHKLDPVAISAPAEPQDHDKQTEVGEREVEEEEEEHLEDWQREVEEEEEEEHLGDWKREEEEECLEDWQKEVEEEDIEEEEDSPDAKEDDWRGKSGEEMKDRAERRMRMGLPFLTGISPAGLLSANRKEPGGTDHLVQVNGKLYPLAKIQLGEMGALHPANRLAAYLTGRVGPARQQRGPSPTSSSTSQAVSSAASMVSGVTTTLANTQPTFTRLSLPPGSTDSKAAATQVTPSVVSPLNPSLGTAALNKPQVLMVQVPRTSGTVPVQGLVTQPPAPPATGQRIVLQTVRTASGTQLYRKLDGKLVQLVPLSQLRAVNPNLVVQRAPAPSTTPVLPITSLQGAAVTISNQPKSLTTITTTMATTASLSGLQAFSVPSLCAAHPVNSGFLDQKGMCTLKIIPTCGSKDPFIVTCPKVPSQPQTKVVTAPGSFTLLQPPHPTSTTLISLKPSRVQGAEPGVKTVTVSTIQAGSGGVVDLSKVVPKKPTQALSQESATQNPAGSPSSATSQPPAALMESVIQAGQALASRSIPSSPHPSIDLTTPGSPELAFDLIDLDIICVDDEMGITTNETVGGAKIDRAKPSLNSRKMKDMEVVDLVEESSDETDNSSDIINDSDSEQDLAAHISKSIHNALERKRRVALARRFHGLRKKLGLSSERTPKIAILMKAQHEIQVLRKTRRNLKEKKRKLRKKRAEYIITISKMTGDSGELIYRKVQRLSCTQKLAESGAKLSEETPGDTSPGRTGSKPPLDVGVIKVVDLLDETEEQTDNSSDEENVVTKKNAINDDDVSDVESVDVETVEVCSQPNLVQRALVKKNVDSRRNSLGVKKTVDQQEITVCFKDLSLALNISAKNPSKRFLLEQASKEIQVLQNQEGRLESIKRCLSQQRAAYIKEISLRSGKTEQRILRKLQHLCAKQRRLEEEQGRRRAAKQPAGGSTVKQPPGGSTAEQPLADSIAMYPPGGSTAEELPGGGTAEQPLADSIAMHPPEGGTETPPGGINGHKALSTGLQTSLPPAQAGPLVQPPPPHEEGPLLQHQAQPPPRAPPPHQAKPSCQEAQAQKASLIPSWTSAASTAPPPSHETPVNSQRVMLVPTPLLAPPSLCHNPSVVRDRPRTIPNILSRRKPNPSLHTEPVEDDPPSIQALVPAEVLSLVGAALPGQQVLTLSPLVPGPTLLHTSPTPGVASVTLNISSLTNQHVQLTSMPRLPPGKVYSSAALLTATNLTARNFPTMLHLVQPPSPQPAEQPPPQAVSSGSDGFETLQTVRTYPGPPTSTQTPVQNQDQDLNPNQLLSQIQVHQPGTSSSSGPSARGTEPSPSLGQNVSGAGPPEVVEEEEHEDENSDAESLTSLLNEIVFLNQQICAAEGVTPAVLHSNPPPKPGQEAPASDLQDLPMDTSLKADSVGGAEELGLSHSPLRLELDEDPSGSTTEKQVMFNGHEETQSPRSQTGSNLTNGHNQLHNPQCTAKGDTLTPPPLLQMKVGGSGDKVVESTNERAGGREAGVAWRPMPRLVPLGLKTNPPT